MTIPTVPDAKQALADLREIVALLPENDDLAIEVRRLIDRGTPLLRAKVDRPVAEATGRLIVRYEIADELKVHLAAARARHVHASEGEGCPLHGAPASS